ncbi:MAG: aminotransferase class I and II [Desulfuromonas sp.]|nr:MAG: aminotransferase class I and II [Desulfuromonas sp.]
MTLSLSPRVAKVPFPPISAVREQLVARPEDGLELVDLCQAVPDYPPAESLRKHLSSVVNDCMTARYTQDEGLPNVREEISCWYERFYVQGPASEEICLTIGASQAFWLAMNVLCEPGDEVIVPLPAYFDHLMGLGALGITANHIPYEETSSGVPALESVAKRITPRTKALLLVTPSNPSGVVITADELAGFFDMARQHDIMLVVDETYNAFLPPGVATHGLFARREWQKNFIHLASFGKTFALTGFRAGALVASRAIIRQALKVQDSMVVCQPHITQLALAYACTHLDSWVSERNREMQQRQSLFRDALLAADSRFELLSAGGFFAWVKHPCRGVSSVAVVERLICEAHIACLPGSAFGPGLDNYLRLAIGNLPVAEIDSAVARLACWKA